MSDQPLFTPVRMGDLDLPNRIVMAPLTRMRAGPIDHVPTALQAEYYAQQASAGLIVAEATAISPPITSWGRSRTIFPIVPRIKSLSKECKPIDLKFVQVRRISSK
jgi:2,4-dienoyl-CoA reductase-like NADH-dependent reductase (Old Yellow Enzyme family)